MKRSDKPLYFLLAGQLVSQVGDKFHMIALAFWVLETTGSSAKMGAVLAASLAPALVLGFFSGSVIDRCAKKWIIVGTDLIRGGILLGFTVLFFSGGLTAGGPGFLLVLVLQGLLSVNAAFFDPAVPAVIPRIVDAKHLARANAMHQAVNSFALVGGAALGGMAVAGLGYGGIFLFNSLSFLVSAGFEAVMTIPEDPKETRAQNSLGTDIRQGYAYLLNRSGLLLLLFMVMVIHFFVGAMEVFMPVMAATVSGNGPRTLGFFQAAMGGGTLAMAIVMSRFSAPKDQAGVLFAGVFFMGMIQAGFCWVAGHAGPGGLLPALFLWGCALISAAIAFKTLLQQLSEPGYQGRVFAMAATIGNGAIPAAMIVFGMALDRLPWETLTVCTGLALMVLSTGLFIFFKKRINGKEASHAKTY